MDTVRHQVANTKKKSVKQLISDQNFTDFFLSYYFYIISDDVIQVSSEGKFGFLSENLGFIINTGKIYLDDKKNSLYVTNNGGKNFAVANFDYTNENVEYLTIEAIPYYDKDILKVQCSLYEVDGDSYKNKELVFISKDNGFNWKLENN